MVKAYHYVRHQVGGMELLYVPEPETLIDLSGGPIRGLDLPPSIITRPKFIEEIKTATAQQTLEGKITNGHYRFPNGTQLTMIFEFEIPDNQFSDLLTAIAEYGPVAKEYYETKKAAIDARNAIPRLNQQR